MHYKKVFLSIAAVFLLSLIQYTPVAYAGSAYAGDPCQVNSDCASNNCGFASDCPNNSPSCQMICIGGPTPPTSSSSTSTPFPSGYGTSPLCNSNSICYTGDYNPDHLIPGYQCGTLKDWHFGTDNSTNDTPSVPACGPFNSAYCCDPGPASITPPESRQAPCSNLDSKTGQCLSVSTAIGNIPTDPTGFISSLFGILLSISGLIAIIIIIISGYRIMVSQGNPEKIKGAREALTSAIIGLLFMIFSVAILQIIGVNILHIPSFMPGATSVNSTNSGNNTSNPPSGGGNNTGGNSSGGSNDGGGIVVPVGGGI